MGCGGSKFDANSLQISARLRPIIHRRVEEIRRRRRFRNATPSIKILLEHDKEDEDENAIASQHHVKRMCSIEDIASCITSEDSKDGREKKEREARREDLLVQMKDVKEEEREAAKEEAKVDSGVHEHQGRVEDEDDDDFDSDYDERRLSHEGGQGDYPGSPSFRIYFTNNLEEDEKTQGNTNVLNNDMSQMQIEDIPSSKETETKKVKKGRKRRSFRKVIPKGRQAAVKTLQNVRSCYNSAQSHSSHDRRHLLTPKTPA